MLKKGIICLLVTVVVTATGYAQQPGNSEALKKKQADIQREIDELKNSLSNSRENTKVGLRQLEMVRKKLQLREQAMENISQQVNLIDGNLNRSRSEIEQLKTELDTLKRQYAQSIVYSYKSRGNYEFLNFIFSAPDFNDVLRRIQYLRAYRKYRSEQAVAIQNTQRLVAQKVTGLETTRREKDVVLQKQQQQKLELEVEKREKDEVLKKLKLHEKEITKELITKQKADHKLRLSIQKAIENEMRLAERSSEEKKNTTFAIAPVKTVTAKRMATPKKETTKSYLDATPEGNRISGDFEINKGRLPWPVDKGFIKIHFGPYKIEGIGITGDNPGLTIETEAACTVKSIFEGVVNSIFDVDGTWAVMVQHGKYFMVYGNLASINVSKGQKINAGELLGKAANNENGNGVVEFVVMLEKKNIDPEKWIRKK